VAADEHDLPKGPRGIPIEDPMIPGERDPSNLTHREPGAVGGQFAGADIPPDSVPWLDERARLDRIRDGGGADAEARGHRTGHPKGT
jgi:hypothetical protein